MEFHVLDTIKWIVGHPTAESWLRIACIENFVDDPKIQHVARFLMEITLFHPGFLRFTPSSIAFGALTLARYTCGKSRRVRFKKLFSQLLITLTISCSLSRRPKTQCRLLNYSTTTSLPTRMKSPRLLSKSTRSLTTPKLPPISSNSTSKVTGSSASRYRTFLPLRPSRIHSSTCRFPVQLRAHLQ